MNRRRDRPADGAADAGKEVRAATNRKDRIAVLAPSLSDGGIERSQANLAGAFVRRGHPADLLFFDAEGPNPRQAPPAVQVVDLRAERRWTRLGWFMLANPASFTVLVWHLLMAPRPQAPPYLMLRLMALVHYLRRESPVVMYAAGDRANLLAVQARRIAGADTRTVVTQRTNMSVHLERNAKRVGRWRARAALWLLRRACLRADAIVGVSDGAAENMSVTARIPRERITTIYNPTVAPALPALAREPLDHPWFGAAAPPVILGVGRLVDQKDFGTLVRAFARVRKQRPARLLILGEGKRRPQLEALAAALGLGTDVALPGFVANPFAYMRRAAVFALSSRWEGLPNVLIEALACGCPVVSTDCVAGPAEILRDGEYGPLVPMGDDAALASAILATLDDPPPRPRLVARGMQFAADRVTERYAGCAGLERT